MKRIELEKAFREHVKVMHGEKARDNFSGSELEGLCITFLQKKVKLFAITDVLRCSFCGDEIKQGEQDYIHKTGYGCCIQEETEKDETHYELFGTTDCDPE